MLSGRKGIGVAAACVVVGAIVLYFTFFAASSEERIRKKLDELAKVVSVKEGDTILSRTARLRSRLKDVVDDDVRVSISELGLDLRGRRRLETTRRRLA